MPSTTPSDGQLEKAVQSLSKRVIDAYNAGDRALAARLDKRRVLAIQLMAEAQSSSNLDNPNHG